MRFFRYSRPAVVCGRGGSRQHHAWRDAREPCTGFRKRTYQANGRGGRRTFACAPAAWRVAHRAGHTLLLRHARSMLASMQRLTDDLGQFAHGLKGTVRLLANTNALTEFVPVPMSHFLADHPNVNIEVEERLSSEIVEALIDGVADIGIVAASADVGALQAYPFATDRL